MGHRSAVCFTIYTNAFDPEDERQDLVPMIIGSIPLRFHHSVIRIPVGARIVNPMFDIAITVIQPSSKEMEHSDECEAFRRRLIELDEGWHYDDEGHCAYQPFDFVDVSLGEYGARIITSRTSDGINYNNGEPDQ